MTVNHDLDIGVINIDIFNEINDPITYMMLCANCQATKATMNDDDLSPEEREEVRESWRHGAMFN